jgi:ATP-binding cassette subfamily B protein
MLRWPLVGAFSLVMVAVYITSSVVMNAVVVRKLNMRSVAMDSRIGGALADSILSNPTVKGFGAEPREESRIGIVTADWRKATVKTWFRYMDVWLFQNLLLAVLQRGLADVEDVARYATMAPQVADRTGAPDIHPLEGEIVFEHVTFAYKASAAPIYRDFNLRIAPGERLALVGPTGSGKSTFVKLVQRLYDLQGGRILLDGVDIATVTQASLRRSIAVVPQDPALFHRTIAENIAYARPGATAEEIALAARRARAHDFISALPKAYDTLVGERGVKLSGGERQRVAIARAFLADAPVLVLDEATSSLDVETELKVQAATEELMAGRTTIVIAHRLSTVRRADRILVFEDGRVVEEGRHGELVALGGAYARLHAVTQG